MKGEVDKRTKHDGEGQAGEGKAFLPFTKGREGEAITRLTKHVRCEAQILLVTPKNGWPSANLRL